MGWLSNIYWENQKDVENDILNRDEKYVKIVDKSSRSGKLWVLFENIQTGDRFIVLYLIQSCGSRFERGEWGYKDMDESMGPCYYDCPQRILKGSTVPDTNGWRQHCLDMAKRKRDFKKRLKTMVAGDWLNLSNETTPETRILTYMYRLSENQIVARTSEGKVFRFLVDRLLQWDIIDIVKVEKV